MPRRIAFCAVGLVLGLMSWSIANDNPAYSFAQRSWVGILALIGVGWALVGAAALSARRRGGALALLLVATAVAWFLGEWDSPGSGSSWQFTIGLLLAATGPPLVAWVMLGYPSGRLSRWHDRVAVAAAFVAGLIGLGVAPNLYFDPARSGCASCATNLFAVRDDPAWSSELGRTGLRIAAAVAIAVIAVGAWRLVRSSPTRRRLVAPVLVPCAAYLATTAWSSLADAPSGFLTRGEDERRRWFAEAAALAGLAVAVAWGEWRSRRTRSTIARISIRLDEAAGSETLRDALATTLGDGDLDLAYALADGTFVDADGVPVQPPTAGRAVTPIVLDGQNVATLLHRPGLLDNPLLVDEVVAAAGLALENERLHAELRAQERELRASRARVVDAGDSERRRLERNLHDGAQQRLIGLLLTARYAESLLGPESPASTRARVDRLVSGLVGGIDELRRIAHGIHPAVLSDEGLAAALESLAAETDLVVASVPDERFADHLENTAYRVVAEAARTGRSRVDARRRHGTLLLDVIAEHVPDGIVDLEDRVGAIDGVITTAVTPTGSVAISVELPCG